MKSKPLNLTFKVKIGEMDSLSITRRQEHMVKLQLSKSQSTCTDILVPTVGDYLARWMMALGGTYSIGLCVCVMV